MVAVAVAVVCRDRRWVGLVMSVLNQMLKDLDERRAMPEKLTLTAAPVALPRPAGIGLWLGALFVGCAALLCWLLLRSAPQMATVASEEGAANQAAVLTVTTKDTTEPITAPKAVATATALFKAVRTTETTVEAAIKDNAEPSERADLTATAAESPPQATALDISAKADTTKTSSANTVSVNPDSVNPNNALASNILSSSEPHTDAYPAVVPASNTSVLPAETTLAPELNQPRSQAVPRLQIDLLTDNQAQSADADVLQTQFRQLQQLQQQQRWGELLAQIHPALRRSYPQQVFALEAHAATQLGRHQQALHAYQQWALLAPSDGRAWLGQALALDALRQPQQALPFYQKAWQLGGWSVATTEFIQQRLQQGQ